MFRSRGGSHTPNQRQSRKFKKSGRVHFVFSCLCKAPLVICTQAERSALASTKNRSCTPACLRDHVFNNERAGCQPTPDSTACRSVYRCNTLMETSVSYSIVYSKSVCTVQLLFHHRVQKLLSKIQKMCVCQYNLIGRDLHSANENALILK